MDAKTKRQLLIDQAERNIAEIDRNLDLVKRARWRIFRNHGLVNRNWDLIRYNSRIMCELQRMNDEGI